jgi:hypothetical protein
MIISAFLVGLILESNIIIDWIVPPGSLRPSTLLDILQHLWTERLLYPVKYTFDSNKVRVFTATYDDQSNVLRISYADPSPGGFNFDNTADGSTRILV